MQPKFLKSIPLSLYIHLPWCVKKCPYCDFNSHSLKDKLPEEEYIGALKRDLANDLSRFSLSHNHLTSIFFGGGTPSLFSPRSLEHLLTHIQRFFTFDENIEITLEANPGTIEHHQFSDYKKAGINRISLGVQSFQEEKLKTLGRIHNRQEIYTAIEKIHQAGFTNFNLDLMYGLPEQTVEDAFSDLENAIQASPTHLSWYHLTLEPNTLFFQKPPQLPQEEIVDDIIQEGKNLLADHKFLHYEVSAFTKENFHSKHNINYWQFGDYVSIGAGAHGKITDINNNTISRTSKTKHPKTYMANNSYIDTQRILKPEDIIFEFMLNALRLSQGFTIDLFEERTGLPFASIQSSLNEAYGRKLLMLEDKRIIPTTLGKRFLNDTMALFLPNDFNI